MSRKSEDGRVLRGMQLALAVLLASCSRQHTGPEAGDSVTNWLAACSDDDHCSGEALCLRSLCTVSCTANGAATCAALGQSAICDLSANTCDLPCETTRECKILGAEYLCLSAHCRTADEPREATSEPALVDAGVGGRASLGAIPLSLGGEQPTSVVAWRDETVSERTETLFDRDTTIALSDRSTSSSGPFATWEADHFRVVWSVDDAPSGRRLGVAEVYPQGRKELRRLDVASLSPEIATGAVMYKGNGDSVAFVGYDAESGCSVQVTNLISAQSSTPVSFPCVGAANVAPIPNSTHWLVTWSAISLSSPLETGIVIARYDPNNQGFSAGPWQFASHYDVDFTETVAAHGDAWAWRPDELAGNPREDEAIMDFYRLGELAQPESPSSTFIPNVDASKSKGGASTHRVIAVTDGVLMVDSTEQGIRSFAIRADGTRTDPVTLTELPGLPAGDSPLLRGTEHAVRIPERGLLAFCWILDSVSLFLLDEQGNLVSKPEVVEPKYPGTGYDSQRPLECDLAWSGSELLVAWSTLGGLPEGPLPLADFFVPRPVSRTVQARIARLPDLVAPLSNAR